jgi:hypothetical protein
MSDLQARLEGVLSSLHAAIARGDAQAVDALLVMPTEGLEGLEELVPRPDAAKVVGVVSPSERKALYGVECSDEVEIAEFIRGRDGHWRVAPSGMRIRVTKGQSHLAALEAHGKRVANAGPKPDPNRKWSSIPKHGGLSDIVYLGLSRAPVAAADVAAAERTLGFSLPDDYSAYVGSLGSVIDTNFARIYEPSRVTQDRPEWRRRIEAYWLWADARDGFGQDDAYDSVVLADSLNGDELLWSPARGAFYVLPRYTDVVAKLETRSFLDALAWMIQGPDLSANQTVRYAEPIKRPRPAKYETPSLDDDKMEQLAVQAVAALRALDPKSQVIEHEDDDGGWTVLLPTLGGSAFVFALGDVLLSLDPSLPAAAASTVDAALTALSHTRSD